MMRQMFSMGERSGLQAGHFSTRILLLRSHDVVKYVTNMWSGIVMLENARSSLKEDVWMGAYVVLELGYTFQH